MRHFILIVSIFIFSIPAEAQSNLKKCYVPEINFTFYVPKEFKIVAPEQDGTYLDENNHPIRDKKIIDEITKNDPKIILQIERKTKASFFEMKVKWTPMTEASKEFIGDSVFNKKIAISLARQSDKFDTTFTIVKIDINKFNKSVIVNYINGINLYSCSYIGVYKNHYLSFGIVTTNKKEAYDLMSFIEAGKFN
jgi:hypothetical protein